MEKSRLWEFFTGDDIDFYMDSLVNEPIELQKKFWEENPDFMKGLPIQIENIHLLQDESYRKILKGIAKRQREKEKR